MQVLATEIPGLNLIKPKVFGDRRGCFFESFHTDRYQQMAQIQIPFVQDNVSRSQRGILRGLHIQHPFSQGKLVQVLQGAVFDVAVDVRDGSPTFGQHVAVRLDDDNNLQFYIPPGFAHGFVAISDDVIFQYKCTDYYHPETEFSIAWNDPALAIAWPITDPKLSSKDEQAPTLAQLQREGRLPRYEDFV